MDEDDEDAPPMLVSADGNLDPVEARLSAEIVGMKIAKVPITIITGQSIFADANMETMHSMDAFLNQHYCLCR